jgi:hypothetical protein
MIKDLLILLSIHPERGWVRRRQIIGYALLAAAFYDLAIKGHFRIISGRIEATSTNSGDPVLDDLSCEIEKKHGKKYSWSMNRYAMRQGKYYRTQMRHLESGYQISSSPIEWLGITWGKRYRVNRFDRLKPLFTEFERVLIYGSNPAPTTRLLIDLLGMIDLLKVFFPDRELRERARKRYRELANQAFEDGNQETFMSIRKELRSTLRAHKTHGW